jgi:2-polyprenyl-6-methoxyphenol hydroxylase-like FAD-dependent oxidoreductase
MNGKSVLISGLGVAGPTLAFWIRAAGFCPTSVEQTPALRSGGYVIDFWGLGYDIAEHMGLRDEIESATVVFSPRLMICFSGIKL